MMMNNSDSRNISGGTSSSLRNNKVLPFLIHNMTGLPSCNICSVTFLYCICFPGAVLICLCVIFVTVNKVDCRTLRKVQTKFRWAKVMVIQGGNVNSVIPDGMVGRRLTALVSYTGWKI
jgi:hypothetical protein